MTSIVRFTAVVNYMDSRWDWPEAEQNVAAQYDAWRRAQPSGVLILQCHVTERYHSRELASPPWIQLTAIIEQPDEGKGV